MPKLLLIALIAAHTSAFAWTGSMKREQDLKIVRQMALPEALDRTLLELTRAGDLQIHAEVSDRGLELGAYESLRDRPGGGWAVSGGQELLVPLVTDSEVAINNTHYVDSPEYRGAVARDDADVLYALVTHVSIKPPRAEYFTLRRLGSVRPRWDWSDLEDPSGVITADGKHSLADLLRGITNCQDVLEITGFEHANVRLRP